MLTISQNQAMGVFNQLASWQDFARPSFPGYDAVLQMNWRESGHAVGLRGDPHNAFNGLIRHSRLFEATSPTGSRCLGFFVRQHPYDDHGDLFLVPQCNSHQAAFRLEMPDTFRKFRHCSDLLTPDGLNFLRAHLLDGQKKIQSRTYVRTHDLWRQDALDFDAKLVQHYFDHPSLLAHWGGLRVSKAFDASDIRWAPTPLARLIMSESGHEGALAALRLGMNWVLAEEDLSLTNAPGIFSHKPIAYAAP